MFAKRDQIDGLPLHQQVMHSVKNELMRADVKIIGGNDRRDVIPTIVIQHQAAKNGLFRLNRMRG